MRIGFLVPADFALGNPGNGISAQARSQAAALERRGHEVVFLNPWQHQAVEKLNVLHFFLGGLGTFGIENYLGEESKTLLVMAPIIDSNEPNWTYRLAVMAGRFSKKIFTIPGVLAKQARTSDIVICRSEYERRRVTDALGVHPDRAIVVLNGGEVSQPSDAVKQSVKRHYDLPDKFILNVSAYTQDRKNVLRLADAAEQLGLPLVLAGFNEPNSISRQLDAKAGKRSNLRLLGFVDRATRDALYALCHVFCLPSIHEGTGLAALEAGGVGARVVITRRGGTRDYFLNHAEYVDPFSTDDIRDALARVWDKPRSDGLADRVRSELSWDESAAAIERAYQAGFERQSARA